MLDELEIRKAAVGPMQNNAYLLTCRAVGAQLLVDAADDPDRLLALLQEGTTAARPGRDHPPARRPPPRPGVGRRRDRRAVAAGADDADAIAEATDIAVTRRLHDGDTVRVGNVALTVVALRGHTPGSVALAYREPGGRVHLFTGDSLFPGGVGATQGPEAFDQLYADVVERVFDRFDDDTWVYPGHGRDTTLGAEREHLPEWRARGW